MQIWIIPSLPKIWIPSTYTGFIAENRDNIWCNKKRALLALNVFKKYPTKNFFLFVPKESFVSNCTFSISSEARSICDKELIWWMIIMNKFLSILLYISGSSSTFKILVKNFENNGKNIHENIVKLNSKQNTNLCYIIIWSTYVQRKHIFDWELTLKQFTVKCHNWVSLTL